MHEVDASGITARQGARSRVTRLLRGSFACLHHTRRALGEQECGELHRTFVAASSLIVVASCPQLSHAVPAFPNSDLVCIGAAAHRVCLHDRSAVVLAQVSGSMCVAGRRIKDMLAAAHGMSSSTSSWPRPTPAYAEQSCASRHWLLLTWPHSQRWQPDRAHYVAAAAHVACACMCMHAHACAGA